MILDDPVEMHINEIEAWSGSPMTDEPWLDMFAPQWFFQQWVIK